MSGQLVAGDIPLAAQRREQRLVLVELGLHLRHRDPRNAADRERLVGQVQKRPVVGGDRLQRGELALESRDLHRLERHVRGQRQIGRVRLVARLLGLRRGGLHPPAAAAEEVKVVGDASAQREQVEQEDRHLVERDSGDVEQIELLNGHTNPFTPQPDQPIVCEQEGQGPHQE